MASISTDSQRRRRILFVLGGKRGTIYLGKAKMDNAKKWRFHVEALVESVEHGREVPKATAEWLEILDEKLKAKLSRAGLIQRSEVPTTLEPFIERYIASRIDTSPNTRRIWRQTKQRLKDFFGADKPIHRLTEGDADMWRLSLVGEAMARRLNSQALRLCEAFPQASHQT